MADGFAGQAQAQAPAGSSAFARARGRPGSPLLFAVLLLLAGLAGAWQTQRVVAAHQHSRFDYEVRRIESAVQERMTAADVVAKIG